MSRAEKLNHCPTPEPLGAPQKCVAVAHKISLITFVCALNARLIGPGLGCVPAPRLGSFPVYTGVASCVHVCVYVRLFNLKPHAM